LPLTAAELMRIGSCCRCGQADQVEELLDAGAPPATRRDEYGF
jgi:hypothetical protein